MNKESNKYDDIINMPHHVSTTRPRMSLYERAAQFSPFAALTGYEDAVAETARLTEDEHQLTDESKLRINEILRKIIDNADQTWHVKVTYFVPDKRKEGGEYVTFCGEVKRIDEYDREIVFFNGDRISVDKIRNIDTI